MCYAVLPCQIWNYCSSLPQGVYLSTEHMRCQGFFYPACWLLASSVHATPNTESLLVLKKFCQVSLMVCLCVSRRSPQDCIWRRGDRATAINSTGTEYSPSATLSGIENGWMDGYGELCCFCFHFSSYDIWRVKICIRSRITIITNKD